MNTQFIEVTDNDISHKYFTEIVNALKRGEPVIFPTDTVYGIGTHAFNNAGVEKIYALKNRNTNKPLVWLIDSFARAQNYVDEVSLKAQALMDVYWPGPLTLIFNSSKIRGYAGVKTNTLGLRVPKYALLQKIIATVGAPLAVTSVNLSGQPSAATLSELKKFEGKVPYIISDDVHACTKESTVIDVRGTEPVVLRKGEISLEGIVQN
ncbi:MAG: L-threonylcarbamoyladenylate synthase [bacterium]